MSNSARIDELRIKFEDNNRRYFAPLANEYRKSGDLEQAIALCREHLPKQPGHMSGYIVFGQALYEAGELKEARLVFEQALDLDPENLIALTHLGDIARDSNDLVTAERWYGRVLDTDPRNDNIAVQLASLVKARAVTGGTWEVAATDGRVTPPFGVPPIGFSPSPTPDSAMRSIDPDVVMRRVVSETPIDLDVFEGLGRVDEDDETSTNEMAVDVSQQFSVSNAQADTAPRLNLEPESVSTTGTGLPVSPAAEADAFDYPLDHESSLEADDDGHDVPSGELDTADIDDSVAVDTDIEEFEDGLLAPIWPDTSDLVSRIVSPRSGTPSASTPSVAPSSLMEAVVEHATEAELEAAAEAAADAAAAFGVEETDQANSAEPTCEAMDDIGSILVADLDGVEIDSAADEREVTGTSVEVIVEISAALAEDAKAHGDDSTVTIAEVEIADVSEEQVEGDTMMSASSSKSFVTETMAELLVSQGFTERAITVYQELVRRRPYDPMLAARLNQLTNQLAPTTVVVHAATPFSSASIDARPVESPDGELPDGELPDGESPDVEAPVAAHDASQQTTDDWGAFMDESQEAPGRIAHGTPLKSAAMPTPPFLTPAYSTPYAQPAMNEGGLARPSAREVFAALAARRVPRRTPPQSLLSIDSSSESLASLFGSDSDQTEDAAARTLADAFAPVSVSDLESGSALDFEFARSTPTFSHLVTPAESQSTVSYGPTPTFTPRHASPPPTPQRANETFSFDRFFPDPASRQGTPASSPAMPDAPVTDDLAQFSAWLKGLGNT